MNVLISGNLSSLTTTLTKALLKESYKVVLIDSDNYDVKGDLPDIRIYSIAPSAESFQDIVSAHKFDVVIYLATREELLFGKGRQNSVQMLDGLLNTLEMCRKEGIQRIFFITSTEVYGDNPFPSETSDLQPASPNGFTLKTGEEYCSYYSKQYGLAPVVIRVPFVYGPGEKATFLYDILQKLKARKKIVFHGTEDRPCSFLHAEDVADFILRLLDAPGSGFQTVNLSSPEPKTFAQLVEILSTQFHHPRFAYNPAQRFFTQPGAVLRAKRDFDWIAERKLAHALPQLIEEISSQATPKKYLLEKIQSRLPNYENYLKWLEVLLGAMALYFLDLLTGSSVEFRYVDFRLVYVVLLGSMYGTRIGLVASLFAGLSLLVSWGKLNLDWVELIYNVSNWLPFALYLMAGVITGYFHDKKENAIRDKDGQIELVKEKYTFLYELYQEVSQLKNQLHRQLVGSRDSFGRIFAITRELEALDEEEVIFKALNILEDVMDNRNIAIYSINQANCYARLEIYSSRLGGQIKKSLNLRSFPYLMQSIETGEIFQNSVMESGYPAYFVPIHNGSAVSAAVVIWSASFEQYTQYYANLLKVICGLVQSSINRVALFMDANIDKIYVPNTRILQPEPFQKVLKVKNKMKLNKLGDYLLVKVVEEAHNGENPGWEKLYEQLSGETRAEDYIGLLEDGSCYILFSQADQTNAGTILQRLALRGIDCQPVNHNHSFSPDGQVDSVVLGKLPKAGVFLS